MSSQQAKATRAAGVAQLDHLTEATMVLNGAGTVLQANGAAWKLVEERLGVAVQGGVLTARHPQARPVLRRLLALAAEGTDAVCTLRRRDGVPPVQVTLLALPDGRVMARLRAAVHRDGPPEAAMRARFGMSAMEAELTVRLAEGGTLDEAARRMQLAPGPAHDLLQRVLGKTGHSSAAGLGTLLDTIL